MRMLPLISLLLLGTVAHADITWQPWSDAVFETARQDQKLVILDLRAVWCHWCHVMELTTYRDPKVVKLLRDHYETVTADQDSRPDLSSRYEDYGWPATIIFDGKGKELAKLSGYLPPERLASLLQAFVDDPTPGPSAKEAPITHYAKSSLMTPAIRKELTENALSHADFKNGGYSVSHKLVDRNQMEWALSAPLDPKLSAFAQTTLDRALEILDPAWGGLYQYSAEGDWEHPHFEKLIRVQSDGIYAYAKASGILGKPGLLKNAQAIEKYVDNFLTDPEGPFFVSQDADVVPGEQASAYFKLGDKERRKQGVPQVDRHLYASENGWMIRAMLALYSATEDPIYLVRAMKALDWIVDRRALDGGGFSHEEQHPLRQPDPAAQGPFLSDTLGMGAAFIELYTVTGDRQWLAKAERAAKFIETHFHGNGSAGYVSFEGGIPGSKGILPPLPHGQENLDLARFANLLSQATGKPEYPPMVDRALRFLLTPRVRADIYLAPGILRLDHELSTPPIHITIVGSKRDEKAKTLFRAALTYPSLYRRVEWYDDKEGKLPNLDVDYPQLGKAAAFACSDHKCSLPAFTPEEIRQRVDRLYR